MKYTYYIWDIGGTLFDTLSTSVKAFQQTMQEFGLSSTDTEIYDQLKRTTTKDACVFFAKENALAFEKRYHEIETPLQENPLPFPDTEEVLKRVVEQGGENYIISNRDLQVVDFLESANLIQYFQYVITSHDQFKRKPSSESIDYLVARFGVERDKALVIGDRTLDVQAGKNALMDTALFSPDGFIQSTDATYTITKLLDVVGREFQ